MIESNYVLYINDSKELKMANIMVYGSTPYVGMVPKKMVATLKVRKWHAQNVDVRLVKSFHEHYQVLSSAFMSDGTVKLG